LNEQNLTDKRKYCFRANHSTELAVSTIYHQLLNTFKLDELFSFY